MKNTETFEIDAFDPVPDDGEVIALVMRWAMVPGEDEQERTFDLSAVTPADDRLAMAITGTNIGARQAMNIGAPMAQMVAWFVAGQQMRLRREPWNKLDHLFSLKALERCEFRAVVQLVTRDDEADTAEANPLDDIDLDRNDADPTQASTI